TDKTHARMAVPEPRSLAAFKRETGVDPDDFRAAFGPVGPTCVLLVNEFENESGVACITSFDPLSPEMLEFIDHYFDRFVPLLRHNILLIHWVDDASTEASVIIIELKMPATDRPVEVLMLPLPWAKHEEVKP